MHAAASTLESGPQALDGAQAFERLLAPLIEPAHRLACGLLHDHQAAEDAVQEASLKAWRKLRQLRSPNAVRPWFLGIVANQCRSVSRTRWWKVTQTSVSISESEPEPAPMASSIDLRRAIRRLRHRERTALVMYFYLDLTAEEIAVATRSTPGAVRRQLYRSLARLRPFLAEES
jgi:RNA polymerase sigma-70 factor (ECF subfamily)